MKRVKEKFIDPIYYSLPIQLLVLHLRKNQLLLLAWVFLFSAITGSVGKTLGIPYLFLDPEYMGQVDFLSFFIVGIAIGGMTMAYHITCYILDGNSFSFLGVLARPFAKLAFNNAIIPTAFMITYIFQIVGFQLENEYNTHWDIFEKVAGLVCGFMLMMAFLFAYFKFTNKDIFKFVASNVNKQLKKVSISRVRIMQNLKTAKKSPNRVDHYFDINCKLCKAPTGYDKAMVTRVFDQNHLNSIIIESFIFLLILALGLFHDQPVFQIPAAASGVLLLTIIMMLIGAITYWLRGWATTVVIIVFFLMNAVVKYNWISSTYKAFGLNYEVPYAKYTLTQIQKENDSLQYVQDKAATTHILENWKQKVALSDTLEKPKMVFICTSGGGLRSALWTMVALQNADSLTDGKLFEHTQLITGASGGLIGASYFRELALREKLLGKDTSTPLVQLTAQQEGALASRYDPQYVDNLGRDNLNAIIFTLLVNDLFVRFQPFEVNGKRYIKDRGYAFEQQLNKNTEGILDKKLIDYQLAEQRSLIPMMILSPAIVNDGRKLFISPQHVSYMNTSQDLFSSQNGHQEKIKGIDFMRFFAEQDAGSLRFLTALRMNAAFPYVTPNVSMPTEPRIQIMDAGLTDNFGVSDATRFLYVFKDWINTNTSGVIFLSIRDSEKIEPIQKPLGSSLLQRMTAPFRFLYSNLFNIQDINNDDRLEYMQSWLDVPFDQVNLEYLSRWDNVEDASKVTLRERPSLSWHLTSREKDNITNNLQHPKNQAALRRLEELLD